MATQIAEIKGIDGKNLLLNQFNGGAKRGLCLQITPAVHFYSKHKKEQVRELVRELQEWLGQNELPFGTEPHDLREETEVS